MWRKEIWDLQHQQKYLHWRKTKLRNKTNENKIFLFNIYAPNHYKEKEIYWNSLKNIILQEHNKNIILGGYPNVIMNTEEKFGGTFHADPSSDTLESIIET